MRSLNEKKLEELSESENNGKAEKRLKALNQRSSETVASLRLASMLAGFLASGFGVYHFADELSRWISGIFSHSLPVVITDWASILIITAVLLVFISFFGYFVPRRLASGRAEKMAISLYGLIFATSVFFGPLVKLHRATSRSVLRSFVSSEKKDDEVSADDIKQLVDIGNKNGVIDTEEKEIIQNIFEFDSTTVMEFCTHRTDMAVLWTEDSSEVWEEIINETRHTLYPVCGESIDDVIGILNIKDYFALKDRSLESLKKNAIRPPFFVPQSMNADLLFKKMKQTHHHFAVVVDEYGGVFGIVTINDLLEQIVGELEEADGVVEEREIEKLDETHWKVLGSASLTDLEEELGVKLPVDDYVNFNGYVLASVGSIPDDGSRFDVDTEVLHIEVSEINANKIEKAVVSLIKPEEDEE